jgi:hypothetical protein
MICLAEDFAPFFSPQPNDWPYLVDIYMKDFSKLINLNLY